MSIFKAYDIRGRYGVELDEATAHRIGRWLPTIVAGPRVLIGRDARPSSPILLEALARGLLEAGCQVDDAGLTSTPMVYFLTARHGYDLSIQITASHNPAAYNGFKVSRRDARPVGYDTGLGQLEQAVASGTLPPPAAAPGRLRIVDRLDEFLAFLAPWRPDLDGLRLAADFSDGLAARTFKPLFNDQLHYLADTPDGTFPSHPPNPLEPAAREPLIQCVTVGRLDGGMIFDGDADRVMFVDETGRFVRPDLMIALLAVPFLQRQPGATILQDIRTSRGVTAFLRQAGANPVLWKVGHAFAKAKMRELGAVFGGELAGHYYFRDFFWCDSGELAALVALGELAAARRRGQRFSELLKPFDRLANTGELNYRVPRPADAVEAVRRGLIAERAPDLLLDFDGCRIEYPDWWASIRPSNTEPYLRVIIEADSADRLAERRACVERLLGG
ncbi:MAG: phosphomannomutase/phosphoglucomutase [Lentisphaerae bacterium]|nr:phosphomannomutase/phosphoglucomutase [Lentisphaerota bacterium]